MWKNTVELDRPPTTKWRMRIARLITMATDTHIEYVIPTAFPRQQWIIRRASMLRYNYTEILVFKTPDRLNNGGKYFRSQTKSIVRSRTFEQHCT
jgi:hypothetical protein